MASLSYLQERALLKSGQVITATTNSPVAIRLRHLGSESVTSVTVTTAVGIVLVGSGTTDTIVFATDTTLGAVVARLNGTGRWEAKLLDGLSTQASASTLLDGAITSAFDGNNVTVWDVKQDTSAVFELGVCLSAHRDFDVPMRRSRVHLTEIKYGVNMGTAAVDSVQVYKRKVGYAPTTYGVESKITSWASVDTTETTINFAGGNGMISVGVDEEIFVRVKDAAALADAITNYVQVTGIIE